MGDSGNVPDSAWKDLFIAAQALGSSSRGEAKLMSEEDRKFLEDAMGDVAQKSDPVRQMKLHIGELQKMEDPSDVDLENLESIVDALENIVCQIDCAVDFCKLGGVREIERFMASKSTPVRTEVMRLLPTILQNNPVAQALLLRTELLSSLISLVTSENEAPKIKASALSGISAMVRGYNDAYSAFRRLNGFAIVANAFDAAIAAGEDKVYNKAAVALTSIAHDLGFEASLDHGLPSIIIKMYSNLPPTSHACPYLRGYISDNLRLDKIDKESKRLILTALERDLKNERQSTDTDKEAIRGMEAMIKKLRKSK